MVKEAAKDDDGGELRDQRPPLAAASDRRPEAPENAEIVVKTGEESIEESANRILGWLQGKGLITG